MGDKAKADNSDAHVLFGKESAAMQWLAAARNLDELDDSTLQEYIDAVGGIRVWNELMALSMYLEEEPESLETADPSLGLTANSGADRNVTELPIALAASAIKKDAEPSEFEQRPLKKVAWRGCYWDSTHESWERSGIVAMIFFNENVVEVRFTGGPSQWKFSATQLLQPDDAPEPLDSPALPIPRPSAAKLLVDSAKSPRELQRLVVYVYSRSTKPFGCVVLEVSSGAGET